MNIIPSPCHVAESSLSTMRRQMVRLDCRAGAEADSDGAMGGHPQRESRHDSSSGSSTSSSSSITSSSGITHTAPLQQNQETASTSSSGVSPILPHPKLASLQATAAAASQSFPPGSGVCGTGELGRFQQPLPIDFDRMQQVLGFSVPQRWDSLNLSRVI